MEESTFRDRLTTVSEEGKRIWVYAKKPLGYFTNLRNIIAYLFIAILVIIPFVKINGYPLLLLNILERRFVIFGKVFWPQDFYILAFVLLSFFVFIILFTAIFGRIWCGWACPQTIFMEMVFRKIEYLIEGDYHQQQKLAKAPWNIEKIAKKTLKFSIFALFSLAIGHLVMAYLVGYENVLLALKEGPSAHQAAFWGVLAFSGIFMFVFSYLREQACTIICPYGRLQGVLLSKSTVVVAYDHVRGEPRGKKGSTTGSCVDCKLCVHVCPTGIDIRNGTQLECINCTACIDACDEVMIKTQQPTGLIRFDSLLGIQKGEKWRMTPRIYLYATLLTILLSAVVTFLITRKNIDSTLLRVRGQTYQINQLGNVTNMYNLQLINKSKENLKLDFKIRGLENAQINFVGGNNISAPAENISDLVFMVEVPEKDVLSRKNKIYLEIYTDGKIISEKSVSFLGPIK
ncbi:MAG: cytochrome c oxidase accessory protein CcoG [Cytophagales bacterium]